MNRLNSDQIRAFLHAVRLGGFGKAADALALAQPADTARLGNLERGIGNPVFARAPRGPAGGRTWWRRRPWPEEAGP